MNIARFEKIVGQPLRLPTDEMAGGAPALQFAVVRPA